MTKNLMSYNLCKWAFACGFLGLSLQAAEPPAIQPGKVSSITSAGTMNSGGYRGPNRNGIFPATSLLKKWPEDGPRLLWEQNIDSGWTAAIVADGRVYFCGGKGTMWAFTLDGKELWKVAYGSEVTKNTGCRAGEPRGTPVVSEGLVYYESNSGVLHCLDGATGEKKWSADLNELGDTTPSVGVSASPLIYRDLVIVVLRCKTNDDPPFVAFHKKTGKLAWKGSLGPCTTPGKTWSNFHQSPILVDTGLKKIVVCGFYRCVGAVDADTGEKAWVMSWCDPAPKGEKTYNKVQPLFHEGYLFLCGSLMQKLQPDGTFKTLWEDKIKLGEYSISYCHTIISDRRLIAFTPGALKMLNADTGDLIASVPCGKEGSVIMADGMLYLFDNRPQVSLIEPTKDGLREVSSFKPAVSGKWLFTHPVISEGRLFLRHGRKVAVYDIRAIQ